MTKEIVEAQSKELAQHSDFVGIAGFDDLTPEDFSLPRMILVQLQHVHESADENPGAWYRTDTNEHVKNPRILVIGIAKSRAMFDDGDFDRTSSPVCRSDESLFPRAEYIGQDVFAGTALQGFNIPEDCMSCVFKDWDGDSPPRCQIADNWAGLTEDAAPVVFRLKGSGYKVSRQLKTTARVTQAKRQPLYIELGSQKQSGDSGVFYTPTFKLVREPVPDEVVEFGKALNGVNLASRAAEVEDFDSTNGNDETVQVYTADEIQHAVETGVPLGDNDYESAVAEELPF